MPYTLYRWRVTGILALSTIPRVKRFPEGPMKILFLRAWFREIHEPAGL